MYLRNKLCHEGGAWPNIPLWHSQTQRKKKKCQSILTTLSIRNPPGNAVPETQGPEAMREREIAFVHVSACFECRGLVPSYYLYRKCNELLVEVTLWTLALWDCLFNVKSITNKMHYYYYYNYWTEMYFQYQYILIFIAYQPYNMKTHCFIIVDLCRIVCKVTF